MYEQTKIAGYLGVDETSVEIIGQYEFWTFDGDRSTACTVRVSEQIRHININKVTGRVWESD